MTEFWLEHDRNFSQQQRPKNLQRQTITIEHDRKIYIRWTGGRMSHLFQVTQARQWSCSKKGNTRLDFYLRLAPFLPFRDIYYFSHPVFIYLVVQFRSNVPALNFPKNQKLDPNSIIFLLVGSSLGCWNKKVIHALTKQKQNFTFKQVSKGW